ncbi:MAG: histidine kinase N-terminal domain-containing protein [Anaerolineae bacterium]|nr:PAS domain-containing sensor histidine kinase [Anaerolineae bacterium]MDW8101649.1 histidine kinase N-terminal domain-containing protein [Anaerolineae bacterium]
MVYPDVMVREEDAEILKKVIAGLNFIADLTKADAFVYYPVPVKDAVAILAHARPRSISPLYQEELKGRYVYRVERPLVFRALRRLGYWKSQGFLLAGDAPMVEETFSIIERKGRIAGVLSFESNLLEYERRRRRSQVFQIALHYLHHMARRGLLDKTQSFHPVTEQDGIIVVDDQGIIRYISGVAANLYRKRGIMRDLRDVSISRLPSADRQMFRIALEERDFYQEEEKLEDNMVWIKRVLPIYEPPSRLREFFIPFLGDPPMPLAGAMLIIYDATEERRKEQELKVKTAIIKEIHHRIKNNLQTVAALLRLQARRISHEEARAALSDSINRILSIAIIHEFLSEYDSGLINLRELCRKIMKQAKEGMLTPEKRISMELQGPEIFLPSEQATACALIINELLQNALEHGYKDRTFGHILVRIEDLENKVKITVHDDGRGLPEGFDPFQTESLGLRIVKTLAEEELHGSFSLEGADGSGVIATVIFPKKLKF